MSSEEQKQPGEMQLFRRNLLGRLNAWQRVWIVASALWAVWACFLGTEWFPTGDQQLRFWADSVASDLIYNNPDQSLLKSNATSARVRNAYREFSDRQFIERIPRRFPLVDFSQTLQGYRNDARSLAARQMAVVFSIIAFAVVPPLLVYGAGLIVRSALQRRSKRSATDATN